MFFEGWSFMEALYMTVITLTTVGYREVRDLDTTGQLWTMALLITGVGTLFYAAVSAVELAVEGAVQGYFERRRMRARIDKLNGHYVLCGFGRVGHQVAREFTRDGVPFVTVDNDPQKIEECLAEGYLAMLGEASDDANLEEAGVQRARGLVAAVNSDAANVFVVLSARKINPGLHIVARASSDESAAKLKIAGADRTLRRRRTQAGLSSHPTPDSGLPGHRHPWREGDRIQARRVQRAKGVPSSQPDHRTTSDRR
jgi:voltage-gated potassium channel